MKPVFRPSTEGSRRSSRLRLGLADVGEGVLRKGVILQRVREILQVTHGQQGHVVGRGELSGTRQPVRVVETAARHAELAGRLVHHLDELTLTAGEVLGHRDAGVVAGDDGNAFDQFL